MTAGLRQRVDVYRRVQGDDDAVGGAVVTYQVATRNVPAAIFTNRPSRQSLEAGIEVPTTYDLTCRPGIAIREGDEVEVVSPSDDELYGVRLTVIGVQIGKRRRNRAAIHATLSRHNYSRSVP